MLGYIVKEEAEDHIKFRTTNDDFTFFNSDKEINNEEIKNISILLHSKADVFNFYNNFIKKNNLETLPESTIFDEKKEKNYTVYFKDPNNITWEIYANSGESNKVIKEGYNLCSTVYLILF